MRKLALLAGLLPFLNVFGQGYKVYQSDGKVDAYPGETAVSVTLNDDSLRYNGHEYVNLGLPSGTRWALTNVGADKSHKNGLHFPFAEAEIGTLWGGDWCLPSIDLTELEVVLLRDGYTEPNTPYVIRPRKTGTFTITQNGGTLYASEQVEKTVSNWNTDFTIHGTYNAIPSEHLPAGVFSGIGNNTLSINEGEGQIDAFRWYVTVSGRNGTTSGIREIRIREFSTEEDAIQGISADEDAGDNIYDISGRKVSRPVKGIYIQDGKKVIRK